MTEIKNAANSAVAAEVKNEVKKVSRRGVGSARGVSRLKFDTKNAQKNGLFLAHLDSVEVKNITIGEESTGMPSFNGLEIPKIVFTFASNEKELNARHYVTLQFTAVESNVENIPNGKTSWKVDTVFDWIKHILDVFVLKGRELTEEEEIALSLSYEDFDEHGDYVPVEPEVVIASWKTLFENVENILNRGNDGQPYYKDKNGNGIVTWIKLLRYIKSTKKGWQAIANDELAFPSFTGEGCIEIYKQNTLPNLRINTAKERITPMELETAKKPTTLGTNIPGVGAPAIGGVTVGTDNMMTSNFGGIAAEAQEDMPF